MGKENEITLIRKEEKHNGKKMFRAKCSLSIEIKMEQTDIFITDKKTSEHGKCKQSNLRESYIPKSANK